MTTLGSRLCSLARGGIPACSPSTDWEVVVTLERVGRSSETVRSAHMPKHGIEVPSLVRAVGLTAHQSVLTSRLELFVTTVPAVEIVVVGTDAVRIVRNHPIANRPIVHFPSAHVSPVIPLLGAAICVLVVLLRRRHCGRKLMARVTMGEEKREMMMGR